MALESLGNAARTPSREELERCSSESEEENVDKKVFERANSTAQTPTTANGIKTFAFFINSFGQKPFKSSKEQPFRHNSRRARKVLGATIPCWATYSISLAK
jgi:hypothetical protein